MAKAPGGVGKAQGVSPYLCPQIQALQPPRRRALRANGKRRQAAALQRHGLAMLDRAQGFIAAAADLRAKARRAALECGGLTPLWIAAERPAGEAP